MGGEPSGPRGRLPLCDHICVIHKTPSLTLEPKTLIGDMCSVLLPARPAFSSTPALPADINL